MRHFWIILTLLGCASPDKIEKPMTIEFLRELTLPHLLQAGRRKYISAASGLVKAHGHFYAVADDEHHLVRIPEDGKLPCQTYPIFSGNLPLETKQRKKQKPDLEAIAFFESSPALQNGALLLIPSGSEKNRIRGALFPFVSPDKLAPEPREIDFSSLYSEIKKQLGALNIEGAVITKSGIKFFNRGNGDGTKNAVIDVNYTLSPLTFSLERITPIDLGSEQGFAIAFTDATLASNGEIYFLAAAEATRSSYEDGHLLGAYIGKISANNKIVTMTKENFQMKPEGIYIDENESKTRFYFVTDPDNSNIASQLLMGF